jgi:hypothetical protein
MPMVARGGVEGGGDDGRPRSEREGRREKERREREEEERLTRFEISTSHANWIDAIGGHVATHVEVAPCRHLGTRQPHATRQCKWHDFFMSHASSVGATEKGQI